MAEENRPSSWLLSAGTYLGEISALTFLHHLSHSLPLLLAGTGSEILVYDVQSGELLASFHVFEGIRVHGITCDGTESKVVVFGEKKVKILAVHVNHDSERGGGETGVGVSLELLSSLPRFNHWVLDVLFVEGDDFIALGLSDNSVALWDIAENKLTFRVHSPDRCLLYSLRLFGNSVATLKVASGTIYNEIIVWRLVSQGHCFVKNTSDSPTVGSKEACFHGQHQLASHLCRLLGHEGSIFRIAWSQDGSKLVSVSDDRSARIWKFLAQNQSSDASENCVISVILYGHDARIWDCFISDTMVITAGEDCSCRLWGMEGEQLAVIKEHIGRGIWRCLYDPAAKIIITAGFDSVIKAHRMHLSSSEGSAIQSSVLGDFTDRIEVISICSPDTLKQIGQMDSKSEYIRCLSFTKEDVLYVATNNGFLYYVKLKNSSSISWIQLARIKEVPLVCMDLISLNSANDSVVADDIVAIGDGKGNATILGIHDCLCYPRVAFSISWLAEEERRLLGIFWSKTLGLSYLFTADPTGTLKLWQIGDAISHGTIKELMVNVPIAVFSSSFGNRITCLDVSSELEVLICGDQRGNLSVFPFYFSEALSSPITKKKKNTSAVQFKGAHGITTVASISIGRINFDEVELQTTGGDGCICYFKFIKSSNILEFIGMKQVKELSIIRSVIRSPGCDGDLALGSYAIGFTSTDFIIWNLMDEMKISNVSCGGWRRPYSFYFGELPEIQNCFAYLKDHRIHIRRLWVPSSERQLFSKVMHVQFHGREIHNLCFICFEKQDSLIATGCEDGTVRLTRFSQLNIGLWTNSRLLGEHVGGSAVRSLCFLSKTYVSRKGHTRTGCGISISHASPKKTDDICLLISVGSKQVLTSWLLKSTLVNQTYECGGPINGQSESNTSRESSSITFQWLSTHMPPRRANMLKGVGISGKATVHENENDWRYLAVTGFILRAANCRFTVCFIVVACSDATLTLRALLLPHHLWFDVAFLVPQASPVLALQHVVFPLDCDPNKDENIGNAYIIISGCTDGSITFWDLTETVEHFMHSISVLNPEKLVDCQRRPRTGRGSQGGRWWKTNHHSSKGSEGDDCEEINAENADNNQNINKIATMTSSSLIGEVSGDQTSPSANESTTMLNGIEKKNLVAETHEVKPLIVLKSVHQSGVNCLHVSEMEKSQHLSSGYVYCVLSGGDDQSLHCTVFSLDQQMGILFPTGTRPADAIYHTQCGLRNQSSGLTYMRKCSVSTTLRKRNLLVLDKNRITSAHSSAVKGVWTDGKWVFSTGLDQRIRCWHLSACGILSEHSQLIISVPEPETLDAIMRNSNEYKIAVAGRGVQMVTFHY